MSKKPGQLAEYAASNRSSCKHCRSLIGEGELRIGVEAPSVHHDGMDVSWLHVNCFFSRHANKLTTIEDLRHHETLRWKDQQMLRKRISGVEPPDNAELRERSERIWRAKDLIAEHLKAKQIKDLLAFNKLNTDNKPAWLAHRLADCIAFGRIGLCPKCKTDGLTHNGVSYVCYGNISEYTKCDFKGDDPAIRRYRFDLPKKGVPEAIRELVESHPEERFVKVVTKTDLDSSDAGSDAENDADDDDEVEEKGKRGRKGAAAAKKGAKKKSKKEEDEDDYDDEDEEEVEKPKKGKSKAAAEEKKKGVKRATSEKTLTPTLSLGPLSLNDSGDVPLADAAPVPDGQEMFGMRVAIAGTKADLGSSPDELKKLIETHGGEVAAKVDETVSALISGPAELKKKKAQAKVAKARELGVVIFSAQWVVNLCQRKSEGVALRQVSNAKPYILEGGKAESAPDKYRLAQRYVAEEVREGEAGQVNKFREKPVEGSDILKVPDDLVGKGEILVTHDAVYGYTPYNAVLNFTDVSDGTNKFYKMAVVQKSKSCFYFPCRWGRIGADDARGGETMTQFSKQDDAIAAFVEKWEKFTGFRWDKRYRYKKQPGKYNWAKLDDGLHAAKKFTDSGSQALMKRVRTEPSAGAVVLDDRVRKLLSLIFDETMMTNTLMKFKVDVKRMPLGRIDVAQVRQGYEALSSIVDLIKSGNASESQLLDKSNQFYMLIPHDYGIDAPPIINTEEMVKEKIGLVEALLEIENAVEIISDTQGSSDKLFSHYQGLRSDIRPLDKNSERFQLLSRYMMDGHDAANFDFDLHVEDIFEIRRHDETPESMGDWREAENRWLLWHGSRLSNWVGIISKGLRIAPKEAPTTGYRLGKGIYLADTVSKSGSYCFTDEQNPVGVMLLSEAVLGKQWMTKKDKYMEEAQPGFDSTFAQGEVAPDPKAIQKIESVINGAPEVQVPCGKPRATGLKSNFQHDEFVVYTLKQVLMRYIFMVRFDHVKKRKGRR